MSDRLPAAKPKEVLSRNSRFRPLACASYAPPALDTTNLLDLMSESECGGKTLRWKLAATRTRWCPLLLLTHDSLNLESHILEQERFRRWYVQRLGLSQESSNQLVEHALLGEKKSHPQESSLCLGVILS